MQYRLQDRRSQLPLQSLSEVLLVVLLLFAPSDLHPVCGDMLQSQDKDGQPKDVSPAPCAEYNPTAIPQGLHPAGQDVVIQSEDIDDALWLG